MRRPVCREDGELNLLAAQRDARGVLLLSEICENRVIPLDLSSSRSHRSQAPTRLKGAVQKGADDSRKLYRRPAPTSFRPTALATSAGRCDYRSARALLDSRSGSRATPREDSH